MPHLAAAGRSPVPELTDRQEQIFAFLRLHLRDRGFPPTMREIGLRFGIRSPNGVLAHLRALEKKGRIAREPGASRAIKLLGGPPAGPYLAEPDEFGGCVG